MFHSPVREDAEKMPVKTSPCDDEKMDPGSMVCVFDQYSMVGGMLEALVNTSCITAENGITPSLRTVVLNMWLCRSRTTFVLPGAGVGNVSSMTLPSRSVSTSKSRRYSLFAMLPSLAPETRAKSVCEGPVVAVQLRRYVVEPEFADIVPRSTVSTICSAAFGEPLCTNDRNAFPDDVPALDTSIRTV